MKLVQDLIDLFKTDLESHKEQMIKDLEDVLAGKNIPFKQGHNFSKVTGIFFEHLHDYYDIYFWTEGKEGEIISDTRNVFTKTIDGHFPSEEFFQRDIDLEDDLYEEDIDEDEIDDVLDEYHLQIQNTITDWFMQCYKTAAQNTNSQTDAYFSIHDSYFRTHLNTGKEINDDEILQRQKEAL